MRCRLEPYLRSFPSWSAIGARLALGEVARDPRAACHTLSQTVGLAFPSEFSCTPREGVLILPHLRVAGFLRVLPSDSG